MSEDQSKSNNTSVVRGVARHIPLSGGIRSLYRNSRYGGQAVSGGVRTLASSVRSSLEPGRVETFEAAVSRLKVAEGMLPVIHNQLIIQMYLGFFIGLAGLLSFLNIVLRGNVLAGCITLMISVACLVRAADSSIKCFSIRTRRLGVVNDWLVTPREWFPLRMEGFVLMQKRDPLRAPLIVAKIARSAQRYSAGTIVWALGAVVLQPNLDDLGSYGLTGFCIALALIFALLAMRNSFEVYKRRNGIICDLYPWIVSPSQWIPRVKVATDDLSAG